MRRLVGVLALGLIGACSDLQTEVVAPAVTRANDVVVLLVPLQDPCPECIGIFLPGDASSWGICAEAPSNDLDSDSIDDDCERQVAVAFAPQLNMSPTDQEPTKEPYWAVTLGGNQSLRILYMFGYHDDGGTPNPAWLNDPLIPDSWKSAHHGDSEWVMLTVYFDPTLVTGGTNGRWKITEATMSAHGAAVVYPPNQLEYPTGYGDYPVVLVAKNKHANSNSRRSCDAGGWQRLDECTDNVPGNRFDVYWTTNVGSNAVRLINCVTSQSPQYHGQECFWTNAHFRGWYTTDEAAGVAPYKNVLNQYGF